MSVCRFHRQNYLTIITIGIVIIPLIRSMSIIMLFSLRKSVLKWVQSVKNIARINLENNKTILLK
jgi:hypothetical protein